MEGSHDSCGRSVDRGGGVSAEDTVAWRWCSLPQQVSEALLLPQD